jgi:ATP-dependent Clp protease ATP-binding subunit ClpA
METSMRWMQEIVRFLPVKSQFLLWGNIYDVYPFFSSPEKPPITLRMRDYIKNSLKVFGRYKLYVEYTPMIGFKLLEGDPDLFKKITAQALSPDKPLLVSLLKAHEIIEKLVLSREAHSAILMNMASRYRQVESEETVNQFFYRMFSLCYDATPKLISPNPAEPPPADLVPIYDPVFWMVDRENEIPDWFSVSNVKLRSIGIPRPDFEVRRIVINALCRHIDGFSELPAEKQKENISLFIDQTAKMYGTEIISIVQLARTEKLCFGEIGEAIKRYRVGVTENPWAKLDHDKIKNADQLLGQRVKGQQDAVHKAVDIIRRAVFNLSGSQYSRFSMRPKGVLFFAGPTGVGKTELAKAVTELLFGSENNYLRFDMSEFGHEHSDQRLVGAPPGYVGYDVGGELTNSVKQNPFSVILFDEIEKAHPKILDMFLQILDDGRLTSGRGETVYFTESLIIFTSNLGIYEMMPDGTKVQRVNPEMEYAQIRKEVIGAIEDFFKYKIARPEILNRIGDNVVVFDFIRKEIAKRILDRMLDNIKAKLLEANGVGLEIPPQTYEFLLTVCTTDLGMGGRGIGNKVETAILNPLSSALFEGGFQKGQTLRVTFNADRKLVLTPVSA